ncbi:hypothetical protein [Microbulbifer halophilus]|uniref:Uncharacterized protein n=1 Tax=Microbulbifer halophilus TaxID=453963 RepID=A0ABW5EIL0_9GAMM|nr:hypothetical protein [Microbulbifer halophilus]MCW8128012.1 hypothetical protein [Microbulbifer halophilus]
MEQTSTALSAFIAQCRVWSREAEETGPRLHRFVEQVGDFLRVHEAGGWIPRELPEDTDTVSELAYWQVQQVMGMGAAQVCDSTIAIADACRVFLFAAELDPDALSAEVLQVFEALLEYTQQVEIVLLTCPLGDAKSFQLVQLVQAIHDNCHCPPRYRTGEWLARSPKPVMGRLPG